MAKTNESPVALNEEQSSILFGKVLSSNARIGELFCMLDQLELVIGIILIPVNKQPLVESKNAEKEPQSALGIELDLTQQRLIDLQNKLISIIERVQT